MGGLLDAGRGLLSSTWTERRVHSNLWEILRNVGPVMKSKYSLDSFLLCDTEDKVRSWMPERRKNTGVFLGDKWQELHKKHWATIGSRAREHAVDVMKGNPYASEIGDRKQDLIGWLYASHVDVPFTEKIVWGVQQNMGRVPTATGSIPCAMPNASPWLRTRMRPMTGFESLILQGMDARMLKCLRPGVWTNALLQDMAGNAFCNAAFLSWLLALISAV